MDMRTSKARRRACDPSMRPQHADPTRMHGYQPCRSCTNTRLSAAQAWANVPGRVAAAAAASDRGRKYVAAATREPSTGPSHGTTRVSDVELSTAYELKRVAPAAAFDDRAEPITPTLPLHSVPYVQPRVPAACAWAARQASVRPVSI
eukprot:351043-Chlamydomonas_euryale.AAC.3